MNRRYPTPAVFAQPEGADMARMNWLFGVTMAERGVSQLVSVDLETAAKSKEAV